MIPYDANTALIVVDVQNDFADPQGTLSVHGAEAIIPAINAEIRRAETAGACVVVTQDWHPEHTPHFAKDGGIWPVHCVANSWGAQLHPKLVYGDALRIRKGTGGEDGYSAFSVRDPETGAEKATELAATLHARGITRVVVAGLATDYCVQATVLDARGLGFETLVVADAIRPVERVPGDGAKAVAAMRAAGAELR
ncbi:MAG: isochorismatase family protein [Pseudomonadota bacterium]|nr:isochorismatase family protein [Pseudomonadota bacterium]